MGKRRYEVSDKTAYRWCERHRRGDSFRKIGLDEGYERRFVARVVRQYDRQQHLQEGAVTLRDVGAGFLREHLSALERAAQHILELTIPPSIWGQLCFYLTDKGRAEVEAWQKAVRAAHPGFGNTESLLIEMIERDYTHSRTISNAPSVIGVHTASGAVTEYPVDELVPIVLPVAERLDIRRARRQAKAIIEALRQHLPDLWKHMNGWEQAALKYETTLMSLVGKARDMGIAEALLESGLAKGLDLISRYQEEENLPRAPTKFETAADVALWLFQNPRTRESLELFHQYRQQLETAYAELEDMLSPWELRKALLARQCKYCPLP
ncbi:MAG: hypothetical protein E3J60_04260 [Dehalococcoidia bacterium]|nr:MAG: hypothetical protein E3J60_04260 [Dehalococcoidia bacterium]